jgi:ubiquinone/menaquinone biosynthesis C-methylase UbiE
MSSLRSDISYGQERLTCVDRFGIWLSKRAILKHLKGKEKIRVLEIGCGFHATLLLSLREQAKSALGIDFKISPELKNIPNYLFEEGSVEAILPKVPDNSFDIVLLISVLEHLENSLDALTMICRVMCPGASLVINVPTWIGKSFLEFSAFRLDLSPKIEIDDHKMYYNKRDLWPLLIKAGFKPSHISMSYHKFGLNLLAIIKK